MADQGNEGLLSPLLAKIRTRAAAPYLEGRVLDFGCGAGLLAALVPPEMYLGVDRDRQSLERAKREHPAHRFIAAPPRVEEGGFDTIVLLAVIEHIPRPGEFLAMLSSLLARGPSSRIVCTTPHPCVDRLHRAGSRAGLFSRAAGEEHGPLFDRRALETLAGEAGLSLVRYRRFLLGLNQLALFAREGTRA